MATTTITTRPRWLTARTNIYDAWDLRKDNENGAGVFDYESFRVMQKQSGAAASVDIGKTGVAVMKAQVRGSTREGQGLYEVDNIDPAVPGSNGYLAQLNVAIAAGDPTNPRIDQVVLQVFDQEHAGATNEADIVVIAGTPTAGTTLDTRVGVGALPASCILLADILQPAATSTVVTANIRDRRAFYNFGTNSALLTKLDLVTFEPHPALAIGFNKVVDQVSLDSFQAAALMYLPRRIVQATRIRWRYVQGGVVANTFFQIAIFDASGRVKIATGASVAGTGTYSGTAGQSVNKAMPITATDFEPGWYYVWIGNAPATGSSNAYATSVNLSSSNGGSGGVMAPNVGLYAVTGGQTAPTTLLAMSDASADVAATSLTVGAVPIVSLSVG